MRKSLFCGLMLLLINAFGQEGFLSNSTTDDRNTTYAFVNATLVIDANTTVPNGTLVITDDKIVAVGAGVAIPASAIQIDVADKYIYPGFIDPYTHFGLPGVPNVRRRSGETPQYDSKVDQSMGWNEHNQSHYDAIDELKLDKKEAEKLRKMGITSVLAFRPDGVIRGTSAALNLANGPSRKLF